MKRRYPQGERHQAKDYCKTCGSSSHAANAFQQPRSSSLLAHHQLHCLRCLWNSRMASHAFLKSSGWRAASRANWSSDVDERAPLATDAARWRIAPHVVRGMRREQLADLARSSATQAKLIHESRPTAFGPSVPLACFRSTPMVITSSTTERRLNGASIQIQFKEPVDASNQWLNAALDLPPLRAELAASTPMPTIRTRISTA